MKKDLGAVQAVFPMPVLMVAAYNDDGTPNVMNAAWGMICEQDQIALFLDPEHKTTKDMRARKAFTVALADRAHMAEADFFGIASGRDMTDKFARTGMTAVKSEKVNAPIIEDFPITMECELAEVVAAEHFSAVIGRIVNVKVEESLLTEDGEVDVSRLDAILFDQFGRSYYATGDRIAGAWDIGQQLFD